MSTSVQPTTRRRSFLHFLVTVYFDLKSLEILFVLQLSKLSQMYETETYVTLHPQARLLDSPIVQMFI